MFDKFLEQNELGSIMKLAYIQRAKQKYIWDEDSKYKKDTYTTKDGVEVLIIYTKRKYEEEIKDKLLSGGWLLIDEYLYDDMIRVSLLFDYDITLEFKKI